MKNIFGYLVCFSVFIGGLSCEFKKEQKKVQGDVINQESFRNKAGKAIFVLNKFKESLLKTCTSKEKTYPQYYGGTYIDDAGNPVILTTDTTKKELIRKLAGCDEVIVLQCKISYQYLKDIDNKIISCLRNEPELLDEIGINTFGILDDKNYIDVSLISCTPEKIKLFKSLIIDDSSIIFRENPSRMVPQ